MPPRSANSATQAPAQGSQAIDLNTLSPQQIMQLKKQLDDELEHLNGSYSQLRGAQAKFAECLKSIEAGVSGLQEGSPILVPLTTSLYVPGRLASKDVVLVDIGTGFYVEKPVNEANQFYTGKTRELGDNLKELESILQGKANNLRTVEDVLRHKVAQSQSTATAAAAG